jgi:hypothetical protein
MNRLRINIVQAKDEDEASYRAAEILVDGNNLIGMLKEYGLPFATKENHPDIAGSYAWPPATKNLQEVLLGNDANEDEMVAVLECKCGCPGCWPFLVQIVVEDQEVIWRSFEQPHRTQDAVAGHWDYSKLGSFVFARSEYEAELSKLA